MKRIDRSIAVDWINVEDSLTFLTGAGISTSSGVPDYRSLSGIYQGIERPEYLLSYTCMIHEPKKFYTFIKTLYHPNAQPNLIHKKIYELEKIKNTWVVSQNIDGLHQKSGSTHLINFHGSLYDCYCRRCNEAVAWERYLETDQHQSCGGQIRPGITLYEEGLSEQVMSQAIRAVKQAELIVIVGTSFQVHPFCDLIHYMKASAKVIVINQTPIYLNHRDVYFLEDDAMNVFQKINSTKEK